MVFLLLDGQRPCPNSPLLAGFTQPGVHTGSLSRDKSEKKHLIKEIRTSVLVEEEKLFCQSYMQNHMICKKERDKGVNWLQAIFLLSLSDAHESSALQITILSLSFFISKMEMKEPQYQLLGFSNGLQFTLQRAHPNPQHVAQNNDFLHCGSMLYPVCCTDWLCNLWLCFWQLCFSSLKDEIINIYLLGLLTSDNLSALTIQVLKPINCWPGPCGVCDIFRALCQTHKRPFLPT